METQLHIPLITRLLESALLPPVCCVCGLRALGGGLDLCAICRDGLPSVPQNDVERADVDGKLAPFDRVLIPYAYSHPVDQFVRALKFRGERRYARVLGMLIAQEHAQSGQRAPEALVPLPLHISRLRRRGFNQAEALARYAAASLGLALEGSFLVRSRATTEQSRLDLPRRHLNVLGAFAVRTRSRPLRHVAIVDDVVTTGSTACEAAFALRAAGVPRVELWAAARALTGRNAGSTRRIQPPSAAPRADPPSCAGSPPGGFPG